MFISRHSFFRSIVLTAAVLVCLATISSAQQNLFNVPSGIITPKGDLFFQEQFNLGSLSGTSNTTTGYGLGNGWEAGFNLFDLSMYDRSPPPDSLQPASDSQSNLDVMMNLQKGSDIAPWWQVGLGTQVGFNPSHRNANIKFQNFSWWVNTFSFPGHVNLGRWFMGGYYSNEYYGGLGNRFGTLLWVEIPIIENKLAFQADALLGTNDLSVIVIGGVYTLRSGWQISLGWQLPAPSSGNSEGAVIEFTYPGFALFKSRTTRL